MRRQLETPCASQQKIEHYDIVIQFFRVKISVTTKAPGMVGVIARGREEGEIPVFGDIPIKRICGI